MRNLYLAISIIILIAAIVVSAQNTNAVALTLMGVQVNLALGLVSFAGFIAGGLAVGAIAGSLMSVKKAKDAVSDKNQLEWQRQDAKLELEKQSDKEKQLEAKIVTLEAALKAALDKQKKLTEELRSPQV